MLPHRFALLTALALAGCGDAVEPPLPPDGVRSGSRLRARFLVSPDGPRQFRGFHDTALDLDCSFTLVGDPVEQRCVPDHAWADRFADDACTRPLASTSSASRAEPPGYVGAPSADACNRAIGALWEVGEVVTPTEVYARGDDGACVASPPEDGVAYREVGAARPLTDFVAGTVSHDDTASRLERARITSADGAVAPHGLFDSELGVPCNASALPWDGLERCIPPYTASWLRSDDACLEPVAATSRTCPDEEPLHMVTVQEDGCERSYALWERGEPITPPVLYDTSFGTCEPVTVSDEWAFVAGDPTRGPIEMALSERSLDGEGSARIAGYWHVSEDGFTAPAGELHDTSLDVDCRVERVLDGTWRCVPFAGAYTSWGVFDDPDCVVPALVFEHRVDPCDPEAPVPSHVVAFPSPEGSSPPRTFEVGARRDAPRYYLSDGACMLITPSDATVVYDVGAEVAADDLVEYTELVE